MRQLLFFSFYSVCCFSTLAQDVTNNQTRLEKNPNNKLLNYNMNMPTGVNGEQFIYGIADIPLHDDFALRLERFYTKYGATEELSVGASIKYFLKKDFYIMSGVEQQYNIELGSGKPQAEMTRLNIDLGHQVKPNLLLEAGYKPRISGAPAPGPQGAIIRGVNSLFLRAKF